MQDIVLGHCVTGEVSLTSTRLSRINSADGTRDW